MSYRFRCILTLLLCGTFYLVSCGSVCPEFSDSFEKAFRASVIIEDGEKEYKASISMSALTVIDTSVSDAFELRDGSIQYLSPDSISDITAQRCGGVVTIGVSGIEITPSPSVSEKYVMPLYWLDLRGNMIQKVTEIEGEGAACFEAEYITENGTATVSFDRETKLPISFSTGDIKITFTEFLYT